MARSTPACLLPHLPEGCYAAPIGSIPVPVAQHEHLVALATNAQAAVERAVDAERTRQLQTRADLLTVLAEEHKASTAAFAGQLDDARGEVKDREARIRVLLDERHEDLKKLEASGERAIKAETRDLGIQAQDNANLRESQLKFQEAEINGKLFGQGLTQLSIAIPPLVMAIHKSATAGPTNGTTNGAATGIPSPAHVVDTTIETDPPPLCVAIAQLAWHIRNPDTVQALAITLRVLSLQPPLEALGLALMREAPASFAALAAVLAATAVPAANGNTTAAATNGNTTAGATGDAPPAVSNGHSTTSTPPA